MNPVPLLEIFLSDFDEPRGLRAVAELLDDGPYFVALPMGDDFDPEVVAEDCDDEAIWLVW